MYHLFAETTTDYPGKPIVLFLGDSITADGCYIRFTEAWLQQHRPNLSVKLVSLGVPSETASGLSEAEHPFPRPCIHNRLAAVLASETPNIVVVCYGMNDGIYHPFSDDRFAAYQEGMRRLSVQIRETGAKVIVMTPPPFDAFSINVQLQPVDASDFSYLKPYEDYDRVLEHYSEWLLSGGCPAEGIIDLRRPLLEHIWHERALNPEYSSGDGIHPNRSGHWVMARAILKGLFAAEPQEVPDVEDIKRALASNMDG